MKNQGFSKSVEVFENNQRMLRRSEAIRLGIPTYHIDQMLAEGLLVREDRGLYRLASAPPLSNPDLVKVSLLIPKAVICLVSALNHHGLTTQIPHAVYISLPNSAKIPRIKYPPIKVVWLSNTAYSAGIDIYAIDDIPVKIYDPEKTLTDCFKFRNKIGKDIAIEALRDYIKRGQPKIDQIIAYAKINRVEKTMRPYLETLI